jgi:hypothetical protein
MLLLSLPALLPTNPLLVLLLLLLLQVLCQLSPMLSKHLLSVTPVVAQVGLSCRLPSPDHRTKEMTI